MDKKFNFSEKLDFNDIDLTAPDRVIAEILLQLPNETNNIIRGKIQPYGGPVLSYTYKKRRFAGIMGALDTADRDEREVTVDIQNDLGEIGQEIHKFECFLYTPEYDKYKYRVFFMKYGIANYPVDLILDESVVRSIPGIGSECVCTCNNREELETLVYHIFNSKRLVVVMQELIRINQAKKAMKSETGIG